MITPWQWTVDPWEREFCPGAQLIIIAGLALNMNLHQTADYLGARLPKLSRRRKSSEINI